MDRVCFISALDNHNPWIANSPEEALATWHRAVETANRALAQHKRETRKEGAFEAQWKKLLRDVRDKKTKSLKATGANFSQDDAYAALYNLVDLYNASSFKLSFLKPIDIPSSSSLASQQERVQRLKRKRAISDAREAGQTGQTLVLQRLCNRRNSQNSASALDGNLGSSQAPPTTFDDDNESATSSSPLAQKRRRTSKFEVGEKLFNTLDKLMDMQAAVLNLDRQRCSTPAASDDADVSLLKLQVSQLQSDMMGINDKVDAVLNLLMQQQWDHPPGT